MTTPAEFWTNLIATTLRELARSGLAIALVALLAAVIILGFGKTAKWDDTKELLEIALPAVVALLGAAIGFYFRERD